MMWGHKNALQGYLEGRMGFRELSNRFLLGPKIIYQQRLKKRRNTRLTQITGLPCQRLICYINSSRTYSQAAVDKAGRAWDAPANPLPTFLSHWTGSADPEQVRSK